MRKLLAVALILAVAATTACTPRKKRGARSNDNDAAAAAGPGRQQGSPSASAGQENLKAKIRAAVIPVNGLVSIGGPAETDEPDDENLFRLGRVCDAELPTDEIGENNGLERSWQNQEYWVNNLVTGNAEVTASEAIAAVKKAYGTCKKYTVDGTQYTIVGPLQLGTLAGVEVSYAWTEKSVKANRNGAVCEAFLGRGQIVSWVTVAASTADTATTACKQIVAVAAKQLAKV
jgi:hypothetical protein